MKARWEAYAEGSEAEYFAWWCAQNLVQSVDQFAGCPLELEPWQLEFAGEALAVEGSLDDPVWSSVVLCLPRKNGKTLLLAAYALFRLLNDDGQPEILLAAASDKQAGRLFDAVVSFVRKNQALVGQVHLREHIGEISRADGGGKILRMANDPSTLHGYSASLVICDELHAWTKPSQRKAWSALTTSGGARRRTQVFTITTAGDASEREESILGRMIDGNERDGVVEATPGLTISRNRAARTLVYNYSAPTLSAGDVAALKLANPASWITAEYLARQYANPELNDAEVLQLHGCVWAQSTSAWISDEKWAACLLDVEPPEGADVYVGVDAALTRDTSAVAFAWSDGDRVHVRTRVWSARPDAPHDVLHDGRIDNDEIEEWILLELCERFRVREVVYDPRYFETQAQHLAAAGLTVAPMEPWQTPARESLNTFYRLVDEGKLGHDGDRVLHQHLRATVARKTDRGWKIDKADKTSRKPRPIDAVPAAAMAVARAELGGERSVYEERGILVI